jgi:ABC-type transport system involved in cytochrome c biogenesis permease component
MAASAVMPLGTWALVCNGTFFAALGLRTRNRELLLPLILFPISIPALLGMMQATTAILTGEFEPGLWIRLLIAYNIAFTTVCLLLFRDRAERRIDLTQLPGTLWKRVTPITIPCPKVAAFAVN